MNNHWPDLERCKQLEKAGFQGITQFVWVRNEIKEWRVITVWENTWTELLDSPFYRVIRAPIVTELLAEIRKFAKPQESELLVPVVEMYLSEDGSWNVGSVAQFQMVQEPYEADYCTAYTLPNALSDLWCCLKEREA